MKKINFFSKLGQMLLISLFCICFGLSAQAQNQKEKAKGKSKGKKWEQPLKKGELAFETCCEQNANDSAKCQEMKNVRKKMTKKGKKMVKKVCMAKK